MHCSNDSVYNPSPFPVKDKPKLVKFARDHNFGFIFASAGDMPMVSSIPMLVNDEFTYISGHLAIANPIWKELDGKNAAVVFPGPNHYISPVWYEEEYSVPTWNYASVMARGKFHVIRDNQKKMEIVDALSAFHEGRIGGNWKADWNDGGYSSMLKAIVGFDIEISEVQGKWKLSQNHPRDKCQNVSNRLRALGTPESTEMADLMEAAWP